MAYTKRTWLGRQGTGLNKFSIGGATPVTIVNQPDSVTQVGDALSAGNLNDLEDRIEDAFDDVDTALDTKADEQDVTNLNDALSAQNKRIENLEQAHGSYHEVDVKSVYTIPSGKGKNWIVDKLRGVSRVENNPIQNYDFTNDRVGWAGYACTLSVSDNKVTLTATGTADPELYVSPYPSIEIGHKILAVAKITAKSSASGEIRFRHPIVGTFGAITVGSLISFDTSSDSQFGLQFRNMSAGDTVTFDFAFCTDLNIHFGGTIPSDADTIAEIQTNYPWLLTPSSYGTSAVNTVYEGVRSGYRYTDAYKWQSGCYNSSGQYQTYADAICTIDGFAINAGKTVVAKSTVICEIDFNFFNANGTQLSITQEAGITSKTANAPTNCAYVQISFRAVGIDTSKISVTIDGKTSVVLHTLTFPTPVSLKSAGAVADTMEPCVSVKIGDDWVDKRRDTQRIGKKKISELNWDYGNNGGYWNEPKFYASISDMNASPLNVFCPLYVATSEATSAMPNMTIRIVAGSTYVYIRDDRYTSVSAFTTALGDEEISYPLANPVGTLGDPILDNLIATEAGGTIESVLTNPVDDSMTLGYINL